MFARGIIQRSFTEWFSPQIESSVDSSLKIAKYHYDTEESELHRQVHYLSQRFSKIYGKEINDKNILSLSSYLEKKREEYGLFSLSLVASDGVELIKTKGLEAEQATVEVPGRNLNSLFEAVHGALVVQPEQSLNGEFLSCLLYTSDAADE